MESEPFSTWVFVNNLQLRRFVRVINLPNNPFITTVSRTSFCKKIWILRASITHFHGGILSFEGFSDWNVRWKRKSQIWSFKYEDKFEIVPKVTNMWKRKKKHSKQSRHNLVYAALYMIILYAICFIFRDLTGSTQKILKKINFELFVWIIIFQINRAILKDYTFKVKK